MSKRPAHLDEASWLIVARRLRFRIGVDHATQRGDAFWWTTSQTQAWLDRMQASRGEVNRFVSNVLNGEAGTAVSADPAANTPDDWGCVRLDRDPLDVLIIGPRSPEAETHADVEITLDRAGQQLRVRREQPQGPEARLALEPYTHKLREVAAASNILDKTDIILVYRGGGLEDDAPRHRTRNRGLLDPRSRAEFIGAVNDLAALGVEVVLGIGHGTTSIYGPSDDKPIGVFEAVTPTAAANWIVREHVNNRMVDNALDGGQPTL